MRGEHTICASDMLGQWVAQLSKPIWREFREKSLLQSRQTERFSALGSKQRAAVHEPHVWRQKNETNERHYLQSEKKMNKKK